MKTIGKILIVAIIMFAGAYWAASNPVSARKAKKHTDEFANDIREGAKTVKSKVFDE